MTYNVIVGTLNLAQLLILKICRIRRRIAK